jgi:hypothetical protein
MWAGRTVDVAGNGADVTYSLSNSDDHARRRGVGGDDGFVPLVPPYRIQTFGLCRSVHSRTRMPSGANTFYCSL